ncbi:MAG: sulfatase-like hydrolase/transferase [Candidatus Synoicihabitans palmerolidicus]|nr:sulfatase-like hydrolase/transferase [Candidatus Synoicihabitans palmerolidicus]
MLHHDKIARPSPPFALRAHHNSLPIFICHPAPSSLPLLHEKIPRLLLIALVCNAVLNGCSASALAVSPEPAAHPNIVVILYTDDLGYGDVGCFGATDIKTPHIDRLAADGIKFTDFYSASAVCTPSRAALLTGRIPQRMGITGVFFPDSFTGMPTTGYTMAQMLRDRGYATGVVGKWHLGHHHRFLPLQRGFDEYCGMPYSNDMTSAVYLEGNDVADFTPDQHYTTRTYTEKATGFIDRNHPFPLYLAHNMPHVLDLRFARIRGHLGPRTLR